MQMNKGAYKKYVEVTAKRSNILKNVFLAFLVGGLICCVGEGFRNLYEYLGATTENAKILEPVTLIFLAALFTGIGWYDKLAKYGGAGTLVPITGFSNAVTAPAIDNKNEGFILGVGAKMFIIAGPVIVYGVVTSVLYGVIYYFLIK